MTLNPVAHATARRNVADRFDRFLNGLQQAQRHPNHRELFWLRHALMCLQEADYPSGEDAIHEAERNMAVPGADNTSTNGPTVDELREQLHRIVNAKD
jgi:hypothetical protein